MTKPLKPKHAGGRPPIVCTQELADEICNAVASNASGLEVLCRDNTHWPSPDTIRRWILNNQEFCDQYARAKVIQTEFMVDSMYRFIQESTYEETAKTRLMIDTIKWKACKLVPKVYGDRSQSDVTVTVKHADAIEELE